MMMFSVLVVIVGSSLLTKDFTSGKKDSDPGWEKYDDTDTSSGIGRQNDKGRRSAENDANLALLWSAVGLFIGVLICSSIYFIKTN